MLQSRAENAAGSNPLVVDTGFNSRGLKASQSVPYVAGSSTWDYTSPDVNQPKTQYAYEGLRRTSQITNPDGTTRQSYYSGRTTSQVDERSHRRDLTVDPFERLVQVKEYTGAYPGTLYATTSYAYDGLNNLVQITDNAGNITKMQYNPLSQRTRLHDPDRAGSNNQADATYWWYLEYDLAGNLTKVTDAKAQVIELAYDELNRLARKYYAMDWVSAINAGVSKPSVYDIIELRSAVDVNRMAAGR
ncbi:MAG: RHS repeat protein [Chloroflexi bacterium]|nr:RHS repeat protein [Chloroflexota bacterium]